MADTARVAPIAAGFEDLAGGATGTSAGSPVPTSNHLLLTPACNRALSKGLAAPGEE